MTRFRRALSQGRTSGRLPSLAPISIVVPARNEASVIARCLRAMLAGAERGELQIVVACNGCDDETASIARSFGEPVRVLETDRVSKAAALNVGDSAVDGFPRFYVDADVELSVQTLREVAAVLRDGTSLAAAPRSIVILEDASWSVGAFYRVWLDTPYVKEGLIGCGVYALSEQGRRRFECFPEIIADDAYVRALFAPRERMTVQSPPVEVRAPLDLCQLIKTRTRSRLGLYQLRERFPDLASSDRKSYRLTVWRFATRPTLWPSVAIYLLVNLIARLRAHRQLRDIDAYAWERDESTRAESQPRSIRVEPGP